MISVLIATRNRPESLKQCIQSLYLSTNQDFKIVIVDQSDTLESRNVLRSFVSDKIQYYHYNFRNKSKALNQGLKSIDSKITAFTDDDCFIHKDWTKYILRAFEMDKSIVGVFGKTYAFERKKKKNLICPSTTEQSRNKKTHISRICFHGDCLGFGNNMALETTKLKQLGGFNEWLGPGSFGMAAEDADVALRMLMDNQVLLYDPDVVVYHDSWLSVSRNLDKECSYLCGEVACYGHYALLGDDVSKRVVYNSVRHLMTRFLHFPRDYASRSVSVTMYIFALIKMTIYIIRGGMAAVLLLIY